MPLYLSSLNSGSNGNCYYIGNDHDAVLVDAGISCRETERRLARLGLSIGKVRAIFVSHEHTDHTRGVEVLSRKHKIPVYVTDATRKAGRLWLGQHLARPFVPNEPVVAGSLTIEPLPKQHDGIDPHSFTVTSESLTAGVFTDIGRACEHVVRQFRRCHAAFLEANYDEEMLMNGGYPAYLKKRIRGGQGHLSNIQSLEIFTAFRAPHLKLLVLSHLSKNNNKPEIVARLFSPHANGTRVEIASRYEESEVYTIDN